MYDDRDFVPDSRISGESASPRAQRQPSNVDIWQAASLLIGVYGCQAADYATQRRDRLADGEDRPGAMIWELIFSRIEVLLHYAPSPNLN